jgi:hypothetical protein
MVNDQHTLRKTALHYLYIAPFKRGCEWWGPLIFAERLIFAAVSNFFTDVRVRSWVFFSIMVVIVTMHLIRTAHKTLGAFLYDAVCMGFLLVASGFDMAVAVYSFSGPVPPFVGQSLGAVVAITQVLPGVVAITVVIANFVAGRWRFDWASSLPGPISRLCTILCASTEVPLASHGATIGSGNIIKYIGDDSDLKHDDHGPGALKSTDHVELLTYASSSSSESTRQDRDRDVNQFSMHRHGDQLEQTRNDIDSQIDWTTSSFC